VGKVDFDNEQLHISDAEREALADVTDDELEADPGDYDPEDVDGSVEDVDDTEGEGDDAGDDDQDGADGDGAGATTDQDGDASDDDAADDKAKGTDDTASAAAEDSTKPADDVADPEDAEDIDEDATLSTLPFLTPPSKEDMEKAEAAYKEAQEKFDEGEIDYPEFRKAERAYLEISIEANQAEKFNRQLVLRQWESDQERFLKAHPSLKGNEDLLEYFAGTVNKILQTPEGQKMAGMKVLSEAKKRVEKGLGIEIPNVRKAAAGDKADEKKGKGPNPRDLARKAAEVENEKARKTVTLKDAPAADTNTDQADRWAHIWRLSGPKFQEAVNKMSPAERQAFENSH